MQRATGPSSAEIGPSPTSTAINRGAWMALIAALMGWMFDGLEMGLFPLVARPALADLLGTTEPRDVALWSGVMYAVFLVGAATGGVVFGWLGDRIGRVWAMTLSVTTYAIFMGLCGLSQNVHQMFVFRFFSALGMGGEWSLGVALVMEVWPGNTRNVMAGLIGAASNVGFLAIGLVGLALGQVIGSMNSWLTTVGLPQSWVDYLILDKHGGHSGWRLLMLFGATPALLTFLIALVVPESHKWQKAKEKEGSASLWSSYDMLAVVVGSLGPLGMIYLWVVDFPLAVRIAGTLVALGVALLGYTFPVLRYLQRSRIASKESSHLWSGTIGRMLLGACLSGVALIGTWASIQNAPAWADQLQEKATAGQAPEVQRAARESARSWTQISSAAGAILGTIVAAMVGNFISRRMTYSLLCIASLISCLMFFRPSATYGPTFLVGVFVAGGLTASFYGWLPLYLPELFRTAIRATCQGFSFNFGRILGAVGALQTGFLMKEVFKGDYARACSLMSFVYLIGLVIVWFAPETKGQPLPE